MKVLMQYRAGEVPEEERAENVAALWAWVEALAARPEHVLTVAVGEGKRIGADGVRPCTDGVFGISVLEVPGLDDATALARGWPELAYGGTIDVQPEVAQ